MLDCLDAVAVQAERLQSVSVVERLAIVASTVTIDVIHTLRRNLLACLHALAVFRIQLAVLPHAAEWILLAPQLGELRPSTGEATLMSTATTDISLLCAALAAATSNQPMAGLATSRRC